MKYVTAYGTLVEIGQFQNGEVVLIRAASSSVGLAAIQIANSLGAIPVALTRTSERRQALVDAGAVDVIATSEEDLVAAVARTTDGKGARMAFDPVGEPEGLSIREAGPRDVVRFVTVPSLMLLRDQFNRSRLLLSPRLINVLSAPNVAALCAIYFCVSQTLRLFRQTRRIAMSPLAAALMNSRIEHSMSRFRAAECAGVSAHTSMRLLPRPTASTTLTFTTRRSTCITSISLWTSKDYHRNISKAICKMRTGSAHSIASAAHS